jgi:hypothetical protein
MSLRTAQPTARPGGALNLRKRWQLHARARCPRGNRFLPSRREMGLVVNGA